MPVVLHVITSLAVGGAEQQVVNLVRASSKGELRHVVCQLGPPDDLAEPLSSAGCEVIRLSRRRRRRYLGAYRGLTDVIARVQPDIVHSWLFHARFAASMAIRATRPPHVASLQGTDYDPESIIDTGLSPSKMAAQRIVERMMATQPVLYVAASQAVKDSYVRRVNIAPDRILVIPNSVDPARARTDHAAGRAFRRSLGITDAGFVFVNMGRLIPGKGHPELFEAFARLACADPAIRLIVAGDGPLRATLTRVVAQSPANGRIRMLGTVTDVSGLLSAADAFVFPSRSEGFPLALAEAMCAGVPTAACDIPVTREMAGDPPTLLLSAPGDVNALAESMQRLRAEAALAGSLGAGARRRATDLYSVEHTVPLWLAAYQAAGAAAHAPEM